MVLARLALCGAFLILFVYMAVNSFVSHSELWAITSARLFGDLTDKSLIIYTKFLFYSVLSLPYQFTLSDGTHIQMARFLFGLIAWVCLMLTGRLAFLLTKSRGLSLTFLMFLVSIQVYTCNIFRVRADILGHFLMLTTLLYIVKKSQSPSKIKLFDTRLFFLVVLVAATTAKSVYLVIGLAFFYWFSAVKKQRSQKVYLRLLIHFGAPFYLVISIGTLLTLINPDFSNIFAIALNYYVNSFESAWLLKSFNAVFRSLQINWFNYVLILLGVVQILRSKRLRKQYAAQSCLLLAAFSLLTIIIHPERWDYFLATQVPLLSLPVLFLFQNLSSVKKKIVLLSVTFCIPAYMTFFEPWWFSNEEQLRVIKQLSGILQAHPGAQYFDSTGALPTQPSLLWYMGPNDQGSVRNAMKNLRKTPPEFIFRTPHLSYADPDMAVFLFRNYDEVSHHIWVRNDFVKSLDRDRLPTHGLPIRRTFIYDHHPRTRWPLW